MIMKDSITAPSDAAIIELKNEYKASFGRLPRGRYANTSSWLTSAIAEKNRLTPTTLSIAHVSTSQTLPIPATASDPPLIGSHFGRKWLTLGLSTIPASDYTFAAGDKGLIFEASTAGSVHIKTIAANGMAARLFGSKLQVGCLVISIQGPNISNESISGETNALAIVQAHALLSCVLTISAPPDDTIDWMPDTSALQSLISSVVPTDGCGQQAQDLARSRIPSIDFPYGGRSQTVFQGYPTTPNSFDFSSASDYPSQTTVEPNIVSNQLPFDTQRDSVSDQTTNSCTGSVHILPQRDTQLQEMSPDARFGVLEMPIIQTDAYGLSDIDGHKMG